jgi:hypothetical protein
MGGGVIDQHLNYLYEFAKSMRNIGRNDRQATIKDEFY